MLFVVGKSNVNRPYYKLTLRRLNKNGIIECVIHLKKSVMPVKAGMTNVL